MSKKKLTEEIYKFAEQMHDRKNGAGSTGGAFQGEGFMGQGRVKRHSSRSKSRSRSRSHGGKRMMKHHSRSRSHSRSMSRSQSHGGRSKSRRRISKGGRSMSRHSRSRSRHSRSRSRKGGFPIIPAALGLAGLARFAYKKITGKGRSKSRTRSHSKKRVKFGRGVSGGKRSRSRSRKNTKGMNAIAHYNMLKKKYKKIHGVNVPKGTKMHQLEQML